MFARPDHDRARAQVDDVLTQLEPFAPEVARRLADMTASDRRYMAAGMLTSLVNDLTPMKLPAAPR